MSCPLAAQPGLCWLRHYNAEMRVGVATWPFGKPFMTAMIMLGSCALIPQSARAQRVIAQGFSPSESQAIDAAQPMLATLPAIQPAAPAPPAPHAFWDRTNVALFSGIALTRAMDYASTRNFQARGRQEILLPDDVVNNSAGFASLEVAATMTSVGISYLFHRTHHHKLERWLSVGHISVTGFGAVRNYALESRHGPR